MMYVRIVSVRTEQLCKSQSDMYRSEHVYENTEEFAKQYWWLKFFETLELKNSKKPYQDQNSKNPHQQPALPRPKTRETLPGIIFWKPYQD
jgi:hypothetical protein